MFGDERSLDLRNDCRVEANDSGNRRLPGGESREHVRAQLCLDRPDIRDLRRAVASTVVAQSGGGDVGAHPSTVRRGGPHPHGRSCGRSPRRVDHWVPPVRIVGGVGHDEGAERGSCGPVRLGRGRGVRRREGRRRSPRRRLWTSSAMASRTLPASSSTPLMPTMWPVHSCRRP